MADAPERPIAAILAADPVVRVLTRLNAALCLRDAVAEGAAACCEYHRRITDALHDEIDRIVDDVRAGRRQ